MVPRVVVPLFVVMNAVPLVPFIQSVLEEVEEHARRRVLGRALFAGFVVGLAVVGVGPWLFDLLAITLDDIRLAGGVVLLVFATYDLLFSVERRKKVAVRPDTPDEGIVPLGIPILVGPATMTTLLGLAHAHGVVVTALSFAINVGVNALLLVFAGRVVRRVGDAPLRATGKVYSLFLAAIAVAMIRRGVQGAIA